MSNEKNKIESIKEYSGKIENFLQANRNQYYSELQIAEQVFGLKPSKEGELPSSKADLATLSHIKDALKHLMAGKKVKGFLLEDFHTMQNIMQYSAA